MLVPKHLLLPLILPFATALPTNKPSDLPTYAHINEIVQLARRQYGTKEDRAQAVVNTFKLSWDGYYKYAFPNDELKPVSNGFSNSRYVKFILPGHERKRKDKGSVSTIS